MHVKQKREALLFLQVFSWFHRAFGFLPHSHRRFAKLSLKATDFEVGELIGSGSYGTVHCCTFEGIEVIGKRAWNANDAVFGDAVNPQERAERCRYYFNVEQHCFEKLKRNPAHISNYLTCYKSSDEKEWMLFELIQDTSTLREQTDFDSRVAPTLDTVIDLDWSDQHVPDTTHPHLYLLNQALGLKETDNVFGQTLDVVFQSLLEALAAIHSQNIVHRDVKPGNLLCNADTQSLVLIDFGSAADMDYKRNLLGQEKRVGLEDEGRVALSPIYSAPEVFVKPRKSPLTFDVFSAGLVFCQLLFNYLDEKMDAGFHQQLEEASHDLDTWLSRELGSKVRPAGLEDALEYLGQRPGLWNLLKQMLRADPEQRISSKRALEQWKDPIEKDGVFLESVLTAMDTCEIIEDEESITTRPLHYVATFKKKLSLGLVLSEVDGDDNEFDDESKEKWEHGTTHAQDGQVFVRSVVPLGQADQMDIFEVGDCLVGIGDLPLANPGFEGVVELLQNPPLKGDTIKLHFERRRRSPLQETSSSQHSRNVVQHGAWSLRGRRKTQEDTFVLHEMLGPENDSPTLVAGVFDGHGGNAASKLASEELPQLYVDNLHDAWDNVCTMYQSKCELVEDVCFADYDSRNGVLQAATASDTMAAGTTASLFELQTHDASTLNVLQCGDSRTLVIDENGKVIFYSVDHSPSNPDEAKRLERGRAEGKTFALPQCSMNKWWLSVGDYQYAVSRSLEGSFATSKGIVSDADMYNVPLSNAAVIITATDGIFEVVDNELVGKQVVALRAQGRSASDAAKTLCQLSVDKGSTDNVSVIVVYLE